MRRALPVLFRIPAEGPSAKGEGGTSRRPRHFTSSARIPFGSGADAERLHGEEYARIHNRGDVAKDRPVNDFYSANKRKNLFTTVRNAEADGVDGTADMLTPNPQRARGQRLHDGIDEAGYQSLPARLSKEERRAKMREALEGRAESYVAFSEDGMEKDFITGGVPQDNIRGDVSGVTISGGSSMFSTLIQQKELKSKQGYTSWSLLERGSGLRGVSSEDNVPDVAERRARDDAWRDRNTLHDRQWREDESTYHLDHDDPILEHAYETVQSSVSIYTRKCLYMDGLFGVERFITKEEERALCEELVRATQSPSAAFVPEEGRYCVNLYERELGVPTKDPLALSLNRQTPLLMDIFLRAFYLGLIPSIPNMAQVSEFVGPNSGYPAKVKSNSIGSFMGTLSLVSPVVMHMSHAVAPWRPKLYLRPRSLYVLQQPALAEYQVGFKSPDHAFHTFRNTTRQTKDYRIEVLFACMDTKQSPMLKDAVDMTQYAKGRLIGAGDGPADGAMASGMPDLSSMIARASDGGELRHGLATRAPMDGLDLKAQAQAKGLVGHRFKAGGSDEMLRRVEKLRSKVSHEESEQKERSKYIPTHNSPTVPGRYPNRQRY